MKLALLCAAGLLAAPAFADELVASNGSDSVRLSDTQCSNERVLEQIEPAIREQLKDATAVVAGESFKACWASDGTMAILLYEDGDQGAVPLTDFKKPT